MAGMNGRMDKAGHGFELWPELFMTLNEVEQRAVRASTTCGGADARGRLAPPAVAQTLAGGSHWLHSVPGPQVRGTGAAGTGVLLPAFAPEKRRENGARCFLGLVRHGLKL